MVETFTVPIHGDKQAKLNQLKQLAAQNGIIVIGDTTRGNFSGSTIAGFVSGSYVVSDNLVTVTISSRPMLLSLQLIKSQFASFLA